MDWGSGWDVEDTDILRLILEGIQSSLTFVDVGCRCRSSLGSCLGSSFPHELLARGLLRFLAMWSSLRDGSQCDILLHQVTEWEREKINEEIKYITLLNNLGLSSLSSTPNVSFQDFTPSSSHSRDMSVHISKYQQGIPNDGWFPPQQTQEGR